jgi:hypothetical protein
MISLNSVNQLIFVMVKSCVFFVVRTEYLNVMNMSFVFKGLILNYFAARSTQIYIEQNFIYLSIIKICNRFENLSTFRICKQLRNMRSSPNILLGRSNTGGWRR